MIVKGNCFGTVLPFGNITPRIDPETWVAPGATVVGDVEIGAGSGIWYGCVVRGDVERIRIGRNTNIQDGTVVHVMGDPGGFSTTIGDNVTIGHMCLIHGCVLENGAIVGMKSTLRDGVAVESGAMVAAGSLVPPGKRVPSGEVWAGSPAKLFRRMTPEVEAMFVEIRTHYAKLARQHADSIRAQYRQQAAQ